MLSRWADLVLRHSAEPRRRTLENQWKKPWLHDIRRREREAKKDSMYGLPTGLESAPPFSFRPSGGPRSALPPRYRVREEPTCTSRPSFELFSKDLESAPRSSFRVPGRLLSAPLPFSIHSPSNHLPLKPSIAELHHRESDISPLRYPTHELKRPYNVLGKVALLEKIINYHFDAAHVLLAIEALETTTIPYRYTNSKREMRTNQVLAIYGDVVSAAQLCEFWINNRPAHGLVPGNWSTLQMQLLGNQNLARVGKNAGLGTCMINGPIGNKEVVSKKTKMIRMATTVEAILGAVHKAGGPRALRAVMERLGLLSHHLLGTRNGDDEEPVDEIGMRCVSGGKPTPKMDPNRLPSKLKTTIEVMPPTNDPRTPSISHTKSDCEGAALLQRRLAREEIEKQVSLA
ncbi:hypothetical protein M0657_004151 [Pyricularia oryzae]|nr:hypothetical protein M0657_004151 [Pyricularia oryzae]